MSASRAVFDRLNERVGLFKSRPALVSADSQLTFAELLECVASYRTALSSLNVDERDVIGLALPNQIELAPLYLALCSLDCTVALISTKYRDHELDAIVSRIAPSWILSGRAEAATLVETLGGSFEKSRALDQSGEIVAVKVKACDQPPEFDHLALLKFTSGSTGVPKGVGLTAENVLSETRSVVDTLGLTTGDRIMALVPLTHSYGFDLGVLAMLYSGASLHIGSGFVPRQTLRYIQTERITVFLGVPPMYRALIDTRLKETPDLSGVRYLLSCTAPLSAATIGQFHDRFGVVICQHYGSSETGAATNQIPSEVLKRPESVGKPMKNVMIRIVDDSGAEVRPGEEGEVMISGPAVAPGYVMGGPKGNSPLVDGHYRTGEIGVLDNDGFLFLRGRIDHLINVGGLKVGPDEVVEVLEQHPAVREAAVIGVRDRAGEEFVYAAVSLSGDADEDALIAFCGQHLAQYKVPRRIDILDRLPRGATGKIQLRAEDIPL